ESAGSLDQRNVEQLAHARIVVSNTGLDQGFLQIGRPAFGTRALCVCAPYRIIELLAELAVKTMARYRSVDMIIQGVSELNLFPEMALGFRPRTPEHIGLEFSRHVV